MSKRMKTRDMESVRSWLMDNDTFTNLSASGVKLLDAAIDWADGRR